MCLYMHNQLSYILLISYSNNHCVLISTLVICMTFVYKPQHNHTQFSL